MFKVLTCGHPCSLMSTTSLYFMGILGCSCLLLAMVMIDVLLSRDELGLDSLDIGMLGVVSEQNKTVST